MNNNEKLLVLRPYVEEIISSRRDGKISIGQELSTWLSVALCESDDPTITRLERLEIADTSIRELHHEHDNQYEKSRLSADRISITRRHGRRILDAAAKRHMLHERCRSRDILSYAT